MKPDGKAEAPSVAPALPAPPKKRNPLPNQQQKILKKQSGNLKTLSPQQKLNQRSRMDHPHRLWILLHHLEVILS